MSALVEAPTSGDEPKPGERRSEAMLKRLVLVGCVYTNGGAMFVKRGDEYRPAEILLGKSVDPAPGVCAPAIRRS